MDSCGAGGVEDVHVGVVIVGVYGVSVVVVAAGAEGGGLLAFAVLLGMCGLTGKLAFL